VAAVATVVLAEEEVVIVAVALAEVEVIVS
jgi:hypothetical protein